MDTNLSVNPSDWGENFVTEEFIPTQEDYRISENTDSDLEENNQ